MINRSDCLILSSSLSIRDVMKQMSRYQYQYALIENSKDKLVGIVTDGDLRRALSSDSDIDKSIAYIMNKKPKIIKESDFTETSYKLINKKYKYIPIVSKDSFVIGVIDENDTRNNTSITSKNVCIIGLGYVGLTLSLVMAESGFNVTGYDKDTNVVSKLKKHKSTFFENGIQTYISRYVNKELKVVNDISKVKSDIFIISVGTPLEKKTNVPNIRYIEEVIDKLAIVIKVGDLVILRSTVPVGTTRKIVKKRLEEKTSMICGKDFYLSFAPERTIEGDALNEIKVLPQIVGGYDKTSLNLTDQLFSEFAKNIIKVENLESAEMVKIMNNTFRDVKFGYANEMALICKDLGLNMNSLVSAANNGYTRDKIPVPSPGVGGPCLPKDAKILSFSIKDIKRPASLISSARFINESIILDIYNEVVRHFKKIKKDRKKTKYFVVGMAFKGNPATSDLRGSNSIELIELLEKRGINKKSIFVYDPIIKKHDLKKLNYNAVSLKDGFRNADAIFIMNNHDSFYNLDIYNLLKNTNRECIFFDGWHFFEPSKIKMINKTKYLSVGFKK